MNANPESAASPPARPGRLRRWLRIITLSLAGLLVLVVAVAAAVLLRPDLSREQLGEYVSTDSRFLELPGGAVAHYRDQGSPDAPPLVLVHGGLGSLHNWEPWIPKLVESHRVVSVDLPAHGLTGRIPGDVYTRESMVESCARSWRSSASTASPLPATRWAAVWPCSMPWSTRTRSGPWS